MVPNARRKRMLMPIAGRIAAIGLTLGAVACGGGSNTVSQKLAHSTDTGANAARSTSSDAPIMNGDHSIIREEAVGPLHVGEWRRPVMSFVYAISARAGRDSENIIVVRGIGKDTVTLTFDNDTLRRVFVTHTGPQTAGGIGVGSPFTSVAAQPGAKTEMRGLARVATIDGMCGVEFATDSIALSQDSSAQKKAKSSTSVRAISVGYCKR